LQWLVVAQAATTVAVVAVQVVYLRVHFFQLLAQLIQLL
jgi:hypothetical protein